MAGIGRQARIAGLLAGGAVLAACGGPEPRGLDLDLRGGAGQVNTGAALAQAPASRPQPDASGLITYPNYQVAVARRGDTVASIAQRIGLSADELGRFNGIDPTESLREGGVIALPRRVSPGGGTAGGRPDIGSIAGAAIDRASGGQAAPVAVQGGQEPVRHQVARGETAFSIARLYGISPSSLAEWNGLGTDLAVREGQFLLIPLVIGADGAAAIATPVSDVDAPVPPSASSALPQTIEAAPLPESPNLDQFRTEASSAPVPAATPEPAATPAPVATPALEAEAPGALRRPVAGEILRPYSTSNEGIDIRAAEGTAVQAAAAGVVAAITRDTEQVPILVLRHDGGLLTVYANIKDIRVQKGAAVSSGERLASVGGGDPSFLHFEVRRGFDAVDPEQLLR